MKTRVEWSGCVCEVRRYDQDPEKEYEREDRPQRSDSEWRHRKNLRALAQKGDLVPLTKTLVNTTGHLLRSRQT